MTAHMKSRGLKKSLANTLQELVSLHEFEMMGKFTTEALVIRDLDATTGFEIGRFFGAKLPCSGFQMDTYLAWYLRWVLAMKHGFKLLDMK